MTGQEPGPKILGKYYDGRYGASHDVAIDIEDDGLLIRTHDAAISEFWPFPDIIVHDTPAPPVPARLSLHAAPETRLFIRADEGWDALAAALPESAMGGIRLPAEWTHILGYAALSVAILAGLFLGAPRILEYMAYSVPPRLESQIGAYTVAHVSDAPICIGDAGKTALDDLLKRLQDGARKAVPARDINYDLRVINDDDTWNALAAPGGYLILFSGALKEAEGPDEIAGILAHEMAHIELHHPMRGIMRDVGFTVGMQMMLGGDSIGAGALQIAGALQKTKYSRENESEADRIGHDILLHAGMNPKSLTKFLERLPDFAADSKAGEVFSYISTHPRSQDRIDALAALPAEAGEYKPALTAAQWRAVKNICQKKALAPDTGIEGE